MVSPDITSTSPFGSVVLVGYQRGSVIAGTSSQVPVNGSKSVARSHPKCDFSLWPPETSTRPSGSAE
jgi:hypothetical protein